MKKPTSHKLGKEFDKKEPKDPKKKPIGDAMKGMPKKGCSMGMKKGK